MTYDKTVFTKRLKEAMNDNNINAKKLSESIGLHPSSTCRYLQGERLPRIDKVYAIAEVLSVDPKWLIGMDDSIKGNVNYTFCPWCGKRLR